MDREIFFEKIYHIFMGFFENKNWTIFKKILCGAIAAEVLNKIRPRKRQSEW